MARPINIKDNEVESRLFRQRAWIMALLVGLALLLLLVRYFYLQVREYSTYASLSENNRVHLEAVPPPRGIIFDRNGIILADNQPTFSLTINRDRSGNFEHTLAILAPLLDLTTTDIKRILDKASTMHHYEDVPVKLRLTDEDIARVSEQRYRLPGVNISVELARHYPFGPMLSHTLGYVSRISEAEQKTLDPESYDGTQLIGKTGLEKYYENILHGRPGYQHVETNAHGQLIKVLERTPPVRGDDLTLFLDLNMQKIAYDALGTHRGAVVAIDTTTGGIIAFVSTPGFDPNPFVGGIPAKLYQALRDDPDQPLYNRALQGVYPPGSTIKPFEGLGAVELGVIDWNWKISDPGYYHLAGDSHIFHDWKKGGHGIVDLFNAVEQSCDTFFYQVGAKLGVDRFHDWMSQFGFGRKTGIDLVNEKSGTLPSTPWKRKVFKAPWYPGEMLSVAIGQGYFTVTPLQLATAVAMLANGGHILRPHLLKSISGPYPYDPGNHSLGQIPVHDPANWTQIHTAMQAVVSGPHGTATGIGRSLKGYTIAGKTGTAQVRGLNGQKYNAALTPERFKDHAWFIAFAPVESPRIAVAVLVENGQHGGSAAAPIARKLFDYWLLGILPPPEPVTPEPKE
ncbi:MAG: penicillin-binding protein 2 [Pseudomonadales bacterium]|nr:penicillin-binding protein 2 [Pseudomonadales bacterium]